MLLYNVMIILFIILNLKNVASYNRREATIYRGEVVVSTKKRKQADFDILTKIQDEKARRGWNEYTLAKKSGIPQTTISTWYRSDLQPNVASIERICGAFNMTLSQFFHDSSATVMELTATQVQLITAWNALTKERKRSI